MTLLDVHEDGLVRPEELEAAITDDTCLVSIMYANNEIGTIMPVAEIGRALKAKNAHTLFHVDAVQSFGKLAVEPQKMAGGFSNFFRS